MRITILFSILLCFCMASFGQATQHIYYANEKAVWRSAPEISGDTLFIRDPSAIHFIKLGDKVYQITVPAPFIEEVKPQLSIWGGNILFGPETHMTPACFNLGTRSTRIDDGPRLQPLSNN